MLCRTQSKNIFSSLCECVEDVQTSSKILVMQITLMIISIIPLLSLALIFRIVKM